MDDLLSGKAVKLILSNEATSILGQEDLIKSLLLNLCNNALRACVANKGEIRLEAKNTQGHVLISVVDNGCGIPAESLSRITEPFYRIDKSRNRDDGGTGIGLALCKQIVQAHGTEMIINSTVGVGTTVEVEFTTP